MNPPCGRNEKQTAGGLFNRPRVWTSQLPHGGSICRDWHFEARQALSQQIFEWKHGHVSWDVDAFPWSDRHPNYDAGNPHKQHFTRRRRRCAHSTSGLWEATTFERPQHNLPLFRGMLPTILFCFGVVFRAILVLIISLSFRFVLNILIFRYACENVNKLLVSSSFFFGSVWLLIYWRSW